MPDPNKTLIAVLLDRSGSMHSIRDAMCEGLNGFLADQARQPGECYVTLALFDGGLVTRPAGKEDWYFYLCRNQPIAHVPFLSTVNFVPRGMTALWDALVRLIDETGAELAALPEEQRPGQVIVVVVTDGQENHSRTHFVADVRQRVEHQSSAYSWQFTYLGANQDAILTGAWLGIAAGASLTYTAATGTTKTAGVTLSAAVSSLRSGQSSAIAYSAESRKACITTPPQ